MGASVVQTCGQLAGLDSENHQSHLPTSANSCNILENMSRFNPGNREGGQRKSLFNFEPSKKQTTLNFGEQMGTATAAAAASMSRTANQPAAAPEGSSRSFSTVFFLLH